MTFEELLNFVDSKTSQGLLNVCSDSRLVKKGDVFVAVEGSLLDGHNFILDAADKGASWIVCEKISNCAPAKQIIVKDSSIALAMLAQAAWGNSSKRMTNLAVTGTNGKTTVTFLVRSIINKTKQKCGLIGTVAYDTGGKSVQSSLTTPDALQIAKLTKEMLETNTKFMVIEASSHALDQNRLAGITFKAAAYTNLTGDHLDYHKTIDEYFAAKSRLFENLPADSTAVLNSQCPYSRIIAEKTKARISWYGIDTNDDISAHIESSDACGTIFTLALGGNKIKAKTSLPGRHNVSNCLAAAGLTMAAGFDLETVAAGIEELKNVPGRLEPVLCGQNFAVLIDFAHTDDALKNVLQTIRPLCKNRVIIVFGCGGDRDRTKRPRMAKVAENLADLIVVTSDNPRTEQPEKIIEEILTGFTNPSSERIKVEPNRKKAVHLALGLAQPDDIVLIAGKGHEQYQIIGTKKIDFSDIKIAQEFLKEL